MDGQRPEPSPSEGYRLLLEKPYLPPDFHQSTFDDVWRSWPKPLRDRAAAASVEARRDMAYRRYGLLARPGDPRGRPLQYVVDEGGNWSMNCLACHQGAVDGRIVRGTPNSQFALETLTEEIRLTKIRRGRPLTRMDVGSLVMPLGTTVGTTNAVMFGVALMNYRDAELKRYPNRPPPKMTHHDHDAPPWWNVRRKARLYSDNFAPKGHRTLMQFLLVKENGPETFRAWEEDYRHIEAYIESLQPPRYPFPVERDLAARGATVFRRACAECHGTYGTGGHYPEKIVPLEEVGTDPVRLAALSVRHRREYGESWFNRKAQVKLVADPAGYLAPPLDGIWASAPYFHNGAVPTLWHLLHPDARPVVWRRSASAYDRAKVGLAVETMEELPADAKAPAERRHHFDTRRRGKSAAGHDFPSALDEEEKLAVLEYLKTL